MDENIQNNTDQSVNTGEEKIVEQVVEKTFTQEQVNGIAAKESKKAQENLLKELGVEDFESAKDGLQKLKEWQESQKTEAEKKEEALKAKDDEINEYKSKHETTLAENSALKLGVISEYLEDVITLAKAKVSEQVTMDEAMKEVVEKYPHFTEKEIIEEPAKPKFIVGGNPSVDTEKTLDPFEEKINKYK